MHVQHRHPSLIIHTGAHYRVTWLLYTFTELVRVMNLFCNRLRAQEVQIIRILLVFSLLPLFGLSLSALRYMRALRACIPRVGLIEWSFIFVHVIEYVLIDTWSWKATIAVVTYLAWTPLIFATATTALPDHFCERIRPEDVHYGVDPYEVLS